jgi:SAM-dependent methyltransferase
MSEFDREKWNRKYREKPTLLTSRPPAPMVEAYAHAAQGREAIDLACGNGRNTIYLASKGFHVDAVDISAVALADLQARIEQPEIHLIEADLDSFTPQQEHYDLAVMTNYLDRELIRRTAEALKKDALFIVETYMAHPDNEKRDSNPDFLLQPQELKTLFAQGFEIVAYEEFWNEPHELYKMRKQGIVAKKIDL